MTVSTVILDSSKTSSSLSDLGVEDLSVIEGIEDPNSHQHQSLTQTKQ